MMDCITQWIALINDRFLGYLLMGGLLFCGIYFTFASRFVQFVNPREMWRLLTRTSSYSKRKGHISSFQAFSISTASRVGTGNIAGVAIAITTAGPGAIFWMWLIAVLGSASAFVESTLAQIYKVRKDSHFIGGPAYYMQTALKKRWMAVSFACLITITFAFVFNSVQANTIAQSLQTTFGADLWATGAILTVLTCLIIFGGLKRIAKFSAFIVPFFAFSYIAVTLLVVLLNMEKIPSVFEAIFSDAFSWRNAAGGALGATIMTGARRGLFSNEAGMGSAPNAAATANISHPAKQGYVQAFSVFVDTLVICSCTAFIVLLSDYHGISATGITLTQEALSQSVGGWGNYFISFSVLLFAFTSIIGNYYYGQANVQFLTKKRNAMLFFRSCVALMVLFGSVVKMQLVWNLADLFMSLMALLNIAAIFMLRRQVLDVIADYCRQRQAGTTDPVFKPSDIPSIQNASAWEEQPHKDK